MRTRALLLALALALGPGGGLRPARADDVVCPDVPLRDQTGIAAALQLDCGAFLAAHNAGALYAGADEGPDCLALKTQLLGGAPRQERYTCACLGGYTDGALSAAGFYRDISLDVLLNDVHCADRCGVSYQQIAQARAWESCGCVNVHGCRFGSRSIAAQVAAARALGEISAAALLVLPDNAMLDASVVFSAQTHCEPPAPVSPRAEILCAANGLAFRWCDACAALCPAGGPASCVRTREPPYCRRVCAQTHFRHPASGDCVPCAVCGADRFELRECADAADRVCAACPFGTFLPAALGDRRACLPCAPGEYSPRGGARCEPAPQQEPAAGAAPDPRNCSALARSWDHERQRCAACPPHAVAGPGGRCEECPADSAADARARACVACPGSHARALGQPACVPCAPGHAGRPCAPCAPGTVNPGALEACAPCAAGALPNAARTACEACPGSQQVARRGANATTLACDFCPEGELPAADSGGGGGGGGCEACALSRWRSCPPPLVMDACRGDLHPRMSGVPCVCGCRACPFAAGALRADGVRVLATGCRLGCAAGARLLPGHAQQGARCVPDREVDALAGSGLFFFSPTDSADLTLLSCADALVHPAGAHSLEPAVSPALAQDTDEQLTAAWCRDFSTQPCDSLAGEGDGAKSLEVAAGQRAVLARYWPHRAALGCFFRCRAGLVFAVSRETGAFACVGAP